VSGDFHIFRLNKATQKWEDTGTVTDTRANAHSDVLSIGSKLYVSSHQFVNDGVPAASGFPSNLYRYSYDPMAKKYTRDAGFPTLINNYKTETLTIDRDTTGKLWATWTQDNQVYVNSTTGSGDIWGTPAPLPGGDVTLDDTSSLIAYNGGILVMWSDQGGGATNGMHFAIHPPGGSHTSGWSPRKASITGPGTSDDHMNLKWLESDGGRIFAATKTSKTVSADPLILLLVLDTRSVINPSQTWQSYTIAKVSECPNRAIVLVDTTNDVLRTFATYPDPNANVCSSSGGAIYEKDSPLPQQGSTGFSFPAGRGTLRIADTSNPVVHNVSSTKQNVSAGEGGLVIADNGQTARYWHYFTSLGGATLPPPTEPTSSFTASPTSGAAPLDVSFTDTSTGSPTAWAWTFGDGTTSATQNPAHTYTAAGTYTAALTATNAGGSSTASNTITVSAPSPPPPTGTITRESVATITNPTAQSTMTIAKPSGTVAGDLLVSCLTLTGVSVFATPPGWSPIAAVTVAGNPRVFGYYKIATASEPDDYTWTMASAVTGSGGIARYSGAGALDTPAVTAGSSTAATSGTVPAVTTTTANAVLVGCMGINSGSTAITAPAGLNEAWELGVRVSQFSDGVQAAAGSSGAKTWTFNASRAWAGWLVALRPG
jgi:PKD repeat protein